MTRLTNQNILDAIKNHKGATDLQHQALQSDLNIKYQDVRKDVDSAQDDIKVLERKTDKQGREIVRVEGRVDATPSSLPHEGCDPATESKIRVVAQKHGTGVAIGVGGSTVIGGTLLGLYLILKSYLAGKGIDLP